MDGELIKRRLGWYGLAWLVSFLVILLVGLVGHFLLKMDVVRLADVFIPLSLGVLGLALIGVVLMDFSGKSAGGTKVAVFVLAVVLALPLAWAPVSALLLAAKAAGRSLEYSGGYAQFRITVSHLVYPITSNFFAGAAMAWKAFQVVASVVGFVASAIQVLTYIRKLSGGPAAA